MANPVIDSVTPAGPITAQVGSKVTLTVAAHDDDAHSMTLAIKAKDSGGNWSAPVDVPFTWTDGLTIVATASDNTPVSVSGMTVTVG